MLSKNVFAALIATAALAGACKKDSDSNPGTSATSSCQVATQTDSASGKKETENEFDASRRLVKITNFKSGTSDGYTTFTYGSGTVTGQRFNPDGTKDGEVNIFKTNSQGFISEFIYLIRDTNSGVAHTRRDTTSYTYNSDGQWASVTTKSTMVKDADNSVSSQSRRTQTNTYTNKRVTRSVESYNYTFIGSSGPTNSSTTTTTDFTYNESSPTVKANPLGGSAIGLLGALGSDKIPTKEVETRTSSGSSTTQTTTTTYTAVIADGLPTKIRMVRTESGSSGSDISTTLYTYKCP